MRRKGRLGGEEEEEEAVLYRDQQQDDARRPLPHLPLPRVEELRKERRQLVARKRDEDCVCEDGGYDEHVQQAEPGADAAHSRAAGPAAEVAHLIKSSNLG